MISFFQARQQILDDVQPLPVEEVPLLDASGRAVAEDVVAGRPLPLFDNSAMDGYAVKAADCEPGKSLAVKGYLPAGSSSDCRVAAGTAVKIMTGAPIPPGADAVVPFEETEEGSGRVRVLGTVNPGDHVRCQGEDIRPGDRVVEAGTVLRPAEISLLASFCMATVPVHRRVRVAILAIGDELLEIDEPPARAGVVNSNSWALAAAVRAIGGEPVLLGIARDNHEDLRRLLRQGLQADALITSAAVSAGDRDLVREVLDDLGVEQRFWKVNIKPGKPTAFGLHGTVPVFSLPGNPVSTMLTFEELVRPALLKMMGHRIVLKPTFMARLQKPVVKKAGRMEMMRVAITFNDAGEMLAASSGDQNTGILRTMVDARGIALLREDRERYESGEQVEVHLFGAATDLGY